MCAMQIHLAVGARPSDLDFRQTAVAFVNFGYPWNPEAVVEFFYYRHCLHRAPWCRASGLISLVVRPWMPTSPAANARPTSNRVITAESFMRELLPSLNSRQAFGK